MGILKSFKYNYNWNPRKRDGEKVSEAKFREQIIENFQDLIKDTSLSSQKA